MLPRCGPPSPGSLVQGEIPFMQELMEKPTLIVDGPSLPWSGERFIPGLAGEIEFEHVHRYLFAAQFCSNKAVLDVASGEGYGTNILASQAKSVIGVDVAADAVEHASSKYASDNLSFRLGPAQELPIESQSIDVVVSFETLEHIEGQHKFLSEIKRVLKPNGLLIMSTPDKNVFMADDHNHFHLKELDLEEFQDLIAQNFKHQALGLQKALAGSVILAGGPGDHGSLEVFGRPSRSTFSSSSLPRDAAYFVAVASDAELPNIRWGILDDAQYLRQLHEKLDAAQAWVSYAYGIVKADKDIINPCLYSHGPGDSYSESTAVRQLVKLSDAHERCVLQSATYESGLVGLRLDLTDSNRTFVLHDLTVETLLGESVFTWDGGSDFINGGVRMHAEAANGGVLVACGEDPQLELPIPDGFKSAHSLRVVMTVSRDPAAVSDAALHAKGALDAVKALDVALLQQIDVLGLKFDASSDLTGKRLSLLEDRIASLPSLEQVEGVTANVVRLGENLGIAQASLQAESRAALLDLQAESRAAQQDLQAQVLRLAASHSLFEKRNEAIAADSARAMSELAGTVEALKAQLSELGNSSTKMFGVISDSLSKTHAAQLSGLNKLAENIANAAETNRLLVEAAGRKARLDVLEREIGVESGSLQDARSAIRRLKANEQWAANLVAGVYNSTSWKVTAPIRVLKTLLMTGRLPGPPPQIVPAIQALEATAPPSSPSLSGGRAQSPATASQTAKETVSKGVARARIALEPIDPTPLTTQAPLENPPVKVVAFYLPQFHPIPENDAWWGKGFTEWTNVTRAQPRFDGHYQPHLPSDLGFYDLRLPAVQEKQVELAKLYGVGAFCFYFYWFAGKRLLETPIQQFASNPNIDFPFCLCWANENWSRRWDGLDAEILIGQNHSPEDDEAFIAHVSQYLKHPNYICIGGKPLLVIYRPNLLPDPKATAARWREWCRQNGVGEIYLGYMQSFEVTDPKNYGFDAAIEFPPNNTAPPVITEQMEGVDCDFSGIVYDYRVYPERSEAYSTPDYKLFRGVFPSWDNEARRLGRGSVWAHATPSGYQTWLENAAKDTIARFPKRDERLVFVNAWNEWAEGAHLEPDQRYGYAWLQATRDALEASGGATKAAKIALVTHDAYAHGAQFLALNIGRRLVDRLGVELDVVSLGDGPLLDDFAKLGAVHSLAGMAHDGAEARILVEALRAKGVEAVLCNTAVSGVFLGALRDAGLRVVCLVHELAGVISSYKLERHAEIISRRADYVVFPGSKVRDSFASFARIDGERTLLLPQGSFRGARRTTSERAAAAVRLRQRLGLDSSAKVVLAVAYGDYRKGIDIFLSAGERVMAEDSDAVFVWVGLIEHTIEPEIRARVAASAYRERFIFPGFAEDLDDFYAGSDVYAMTSREDPFPMVVLEALQVGTPVVGFEGAGDFDTLLRTGAGVLVEPSGDCSMADALLSLLRGPSRRLAMGDIGQTVIEFDYAFDRYVMTLFGLLKPEFKRVSVVVPNYNYAKYIKDRLFTIDAQTYPPYEIFILDDKSTDGCIDIINAVTPGLKTPVRLVLSDQNSGSVFKQWRKGVELARGDLVWIAEADDLAEPGLLEAALKGFEDPDVVLSFVQSKQIGSDGEVLANDYLDYVKDVDPDKWSESYVAEGQEEISAAMAIKNTIPNVSAVVFRRDALARVLSDDFEEIAAMKVAGDWIAYIRLLMTGKVAFNAAPLNLHRRHTGSVTVSSFNIGQLREIVAVQRMARRVVKVPDTVAERSDSYSQSLYELFGLAKTNGAKWKDDPAFRDIIETHSNSHVDANKQGLS